MFITAMHPYSMRPDRLQHSAIREPCNEFRNFLQYGSRTHTAFRV